MKKRNYFSLLITFLMSLAIALFIGVAAAQVAQDFNYRANPVLIAGIFFAFKVLYFALTRWTVRGLALAGVNQEIWIEELLDNFYALDQADDPLNGVDDWSQWVENNTINFASVGTDPVVLKNNAVWPIVAVQRTDNALNVPLDTYDSTTTRVRNVEEIESKPDKLKSVVKQHKLKLQQDITDEALVNYAPTSNATATPVIQTTGATRTIVVAGGTLSTVGNRLTVTDITNAAERFDILNYPKFRRMLIHPAHVRDLRDTDATLFKSLTELKTGQVYDYAGFTISKYSNTPVYTKATYAKKAFGAAVDLVNDVPASTIYCPGEMMKCLGTSEMFYKEKRINPEQRAHEVGFQQRAKCATKRGQVAIGAIVTARA
jgi:hypothetical protein